jgi:hypothetical protein
MSRLDYNGGSDISYANRRSFSEDTGMAWGWIGEES